MPVRKELSEAALAKIEENRQLAIAKQQARMLERQEQEEFYRMEELDREITRKKLEEKKVADMIQQATLFMDE